LQPVAIICASGETRTRCKHPDKQVTFSLVKILKLQNRCQIVVQGWQKKHPDEAGQVVFGSEGTVHPGMGCQTLACALKIRVKQFTVE